MNAHELTLAGLNEHRLFTILDLTGTFAFAISGAVAARDRGLDLFGIMAIAFIVACGGGVMRDLCIGAVPPTGLTDWRYLTVAMAAAWMSIAANKFVVRLAHPVILFDSLGLGLFAVTGAQKAIIYGHNAEVAVLLGVGIAVFIMHRDPGPRGPPPASQGGLVVEEGRDEQSHQRARLRLRPRQAKAEQRRGKQHRAPQCRRSSRGMGGTAIGRRRRFVA